MPVLEVRKPGDDEKELPAVPVPATSAGVAYVFGDFSTGRGRMGHRYVRATITNNSGDVVTFSDEHGRSFPVQAGQAAEWDLAPGVNYLRMIPTVDVTAGQVVVIPRVRVLAEG